MPFRKLARSVHENARNVARKLSATPEFKQSRRDRTKVEMLFAHLKRILMLHRLMAAKAKGSTHLSGSAIIADAAEDVVVSPVAVPRRDWVARRRLISATHPLGILHLP